MFIEKGRSYLADEGQAGCNECGRIKIAKIKEVKDNRLKWDETFLNIFFHKSLSGTKKAVILHSRFERKDRGEKGNGKKEKEYKFFESLKPKAWKGKTHNLFNFFLQ